MQSGERRLAAIMFTDIVGYTHLSQANESLALELLEEHREILRPVFLSHGGTEVKTIGDAFLVEFRSALDAVTCAVEMQEKMNERNKRAPADRKLELRIGIHVGDVVRKPDDIYGDAVNLASRIEPLAEPGGISISQQVFDQIRNKTSLEIEKVGNVELKNVDLPLPVYRVRTMMRERSIDQAPAPRERLAVLPFVNISPDPSDEYFADGLTEELIAKLSKIRDLKVIARTSVMSYKHKDKKVSEIAKELDVGSIIEGSVRKASDRIRISVQLIDPRTEEHLWSANYDAKLDDIFAIQSDVASKVADALSAAFFSSAPKKDTRDMEAYTMYLRAVQLSYDMTEASLRESLDLLQRAILRDPKFARAYAALADAYHRLSVMGYANFATMAAKAELAAKKALELDPGLAEAHSAMATVHSMLDRFDEALAETEAAIRINPSHADAYMALVVLDSIRRTPGEALETAEKAYDLDPLSAGAGGMVVMLAGWSGDRELARQALAREKELNPRKGRVYLLAADLEMESGNFEEAQRMIDLAQKLTPDEPMAIQSQAILFAMQGKRRQAEEWLEKIPTTDNESFKLTSELDVRAALGDLDRAFQILERQTEMHSWPAFIRFDPLYAPLRKDPRYLEFCNKVGILP